MFFTKHATYNDSVNLQLVSNEAIRFGGNGDKMGFVYSCGIDQVTTVGNNQEIDFRKSLSIDVIDHGHGLTLDWSLGFSPGDFNVYGFQNDSTGKIHMGNEALGPVTFRPDAGHNGFVASLGGPNGINVDFRGFSNLAALEARFV